MDSFFDGSKALEIQKKMEPPIDTDNTVDGRNPALVDM